VIDPQTPPEVKFDIFKRINTGGTPLNAQEIRHCLSSGRSRSFLAALASVEDFSYATNGVVKDHKRMTDRELALRFCALKLWREGKIRYEDYHGSMDKFLDAVNELPGAGKQIGDSEQERLKASFANAMSNARVIFDRFAFRKNESAQLNKALFDSISVCLSEYDRSVVEKHSGEIKRAVYRLIEEDSEFMDAISQSTNSVKKVKYRFERMETLFTEILQ
jgi:hypothetical protein